MSDTAKFFLSFLIWILGSAGMASLIRSFSTTEWTNWVIIVFVLALGGGCIWLYKNL